jgi:hypothetical protein
MNLYSGAHLGEEFRRFRKNLRWRNIPEEARVAAHLLPPSPARRRAGAIFHQVTRPTRQSIPMGFGLMCHDPNTMRPIMMDLDLS